jgi:F-type H+-transporting ATPase subunit gamma
MDTLEGLAAQIGTAEEIQSIVRVMKSLSTVSIEQFDRAVAALDAYQETVELGLRAALREGRPPPAGPPGAARARAVVVVGSERGLCGRFNETVVLHALHGPLSGDPPPRLLAVGLRGADRLSAAGREPDALADLPGSAEGLTAATQRVILTLDRWRRAGEAADIRVCYNRRRPGGGLEPLTDRLSPADPNWLDRLAREPWPGRGLPLLGDEREALLPRLLREQIFLGVYRALARSLASEHAARLSAMQAADRNIDERREALAGRYRKKRQEAITAELLDIVAGFRATGGG